MKISQSRKIQLHVTNKPKFEIQNTHFEDSPLSWFTVLELRLHFFKQR